MTENKDSKTYNFEFICKCDCEQECYKERCKKDYVKKIIKTIVEGIYMALRDSQEFKKVNIKVLIENYKVDFILLFERTYKYEGKIKSVKKAKKVREEGICYNFNYLGMCNNDDVDLELIYVMVTKIRELIGHKIPNDLIEYADSFLKI